MSDDYDYDSQFGTPQKPQKQGKHQKVDVTDSYVDTINQTITNTQTVHNRGLPVVAIVGIVGLSLVVVFGLVVLSGLLGGAKVGVANTAIPNTQSPILPTDTPKPVNQTALRVNRLTTSTIMVTAGDSVTITAGGFIKVGDFVGSVDPDGREAGLFGASLETYNLQTNFPHGSLMCRVQGESQWHFCGTHLSFIAPISGMLEFEVNDNDKSNNSGLFDVTVEIE